MSESVYAADDPRLVESEQRYRAVIDNASDMIQSVRPDGTFEFVNQAWLTTLGYNLQEVEGMTIWDIIYPEALEHCQVAFMKAVQGETIASMETTFVTKDGRPIPVEGSATSRFLGDTVVATHGFFRDISERMKAQELEERNTQLEREQRARYLEKMAALGKLSAGLAHELNNPAAAAQRAASRLTESLAKRDAAMRDLTSHDLQLDAWRSIDAFLEETQKSNPATASLNPLEIDEQETAIEEWLEDHGIEQAWEVATDLVHAGVTEQRLEQLAQQLPSPVTTPAIKWLTEVLTARQLTDIIVRSSHRISELVESVKGYSYMDRGAEQEADVHEGIESTLIILGHRLRDTSITRDYDPNLPSIRVFSNTLNQVWTNILDNAIDATDGKGTISIRTSYENGAVHVQIEDNGGGIRPDDLACIFEPFFTTKAQGQGTGLGLDTAWRIITEEHGGMIQVESEPGRTVFKVTIPLETS